MTVYVLLMRDIAYQYNLGEIRFCNEGVGVGNGDAKRLCPSVLNRF
jgi:hypothetical protein